METAIDASKTALVVIDLQKGIVGMQTAPYDSSAVVANAARLASRAREKGMPVFLVHVAFSPDRKDALAPLADASMQSPAPPPDWADIVPEMRQAASDFVITKHQWGAFYGTKLELELRRRGIDTIILCGIATSIGVESTARFAYEYGFQQIFAEDAMADRSAEAHAMSTKTHFPRMGRVRATADILAAL